MNTNWTTKEEYLQFVSDWKDAYKTYTFAARLAKAIDRGGRSFRSGMNRWNLDEEKLGVWKKEVSEAYARYQKLTGGSWITPQRMLEIRKEQKVRAGIARAACRVSC